MELVPLDKNLPDVVARLVRNIEAGDPQAHEPTVPQEFPVVGTAEDQLDTRSEPRG